MTIGRDWNTHREAAIQTAFLDHIPKLFNLKHQRFSEFYIVAHLKLTNYTRFTLHTWEWWWSSHLTLNSGKKRWKQWWLTVCCMGEQCRVSPKDSTLWLALLQLEGKDLSKNSLDMICWNENLLTINSPLHIVGHPSCTLSFLRRFLTLLYNTRLLLSHLSTLESIFT